MSELHKLREVAERLGVSEKSARRYVKSGLLPSVFVGNSYRVTEADIEEFLRASRVGPNGKRPKASRRSPDLEPSLEEVLEEKERQALGTAYLTARREAHRLLQVHRQRIDSLANRWEAEVDTLTPQEVRATLEHEEGVLESGILEINVPTNPDVEAVVDTAVLDEADHFEVEMIARAIERMRDIAETVIGKGEVDTLLAEVERKAPSIRAETEARMPQVS